MTSEVTPVILCDDERTRFAMKRSRDIEVEITFLPTEHGGRSTPAFNGYRPQFYIAGSDWAAEHEYPDVAQVNPGDTVRAYLSVLHAEHLSGRIAPGQPFLIREGHRVVGYGSITRIVNLGQSAEAARAKTAGEST